MDLVRKAGKFLNRGLRDVTRLDDAGRRVRWGLGIARKSSLPIDVLPVRRYSDMSDMVGEIAPATTCTVAAPAGFGRANDPASHRIHALRALRFRNVVASGSSAALLVNDAIGLPDHHLASPDRILTDGRFLLWHGQDQTGVLCSVRKPLPASNGIALFGTGAFNWYHWLIEKLPAAFLAERLPRTFEDTPLIVHQDMLEIPSFRDSLALFARNRRIETIGDVPSRFDELFVFDSPVQEPFNMRPGRWPSPGDYAYNAEIMRAYREAILDRLDILRRPPTRRIFLARSHGRRSYNQDEALSLAKEFGFEAVFAEKLSFRDQVQMMHDAAMVIGPSGASFANSLFCQPGTRLLSWLIPEYGGFCSYTNMAAITRSNISYLFTPTEHSIDNTGEAFVVTYQLDLSAFRATLEKIAGSVAKV